MFRNAFPCLLLVVLISCSDETKEPFSLTGSVRGRVQLVNELGGNDPGKGGVTLTLTSAGQEIQTTADQDGYYELRDIPTGTYNLAATKTGFGVYREFGVKVMGGEEPLFMNVVLERPSTSTVSNVTMSLGNGIILLNGTQHNNYPKPFAWNAYFVVFYGNSPDVSPQKHIHSETQIIFSTSPGFWASAAYDARMFPSGSTVYAVVYGLTSSTATRFDAENAIYYYPALGTIPSNVASLKIP